MDYPNNGITVDLLLLGKMVTGLNDAHLRQKWYKEGKDLTMEMALHIIRIYVAKHKAQGMTVNYVKGKGKGPGKGKAQQSNSNSKWALKRARPKTTTRTSVGMEKRNLSVQQLIRSANSARKKDITRCYVERRNLLYTR